MTSDRPDPEEPRGRILRFRPRGASPLRNYFRRPVAHEPTTPPVEGLGKYEGAADGDDYRHRMITNGLALIVIAILIGAGVWIANTMAEMRKNQDCFLQGRKNCTPIDVTQPLRR